MERRAAKEAKRKREAEAALRAQIDTQFIQKGTSVGPITDHDIHEIDGAGFGKPIVGALGGVIGQLVIVLSILEKNFNRQLTTGSRKSKKSQKSSTSQRREDKRRAEEEARKKEEDDVAKVNAENPGSEPTIIQNGWFTKQNIQNFIHEFINGDAMKPEKMPLTVGLAYERFLSGLERKMVLNDMRVMKEPNYSKLREMLRSPASYGDPVLRLIAEHPEQIGVSKNTYTMVYEGFWDLYCKKPGTADLTARRLEGWINKINLRTPATAPGKTLGVTEEIPAADENEEEVEEGELKQGPPLKAIVRIRVPLARPEDEEVAAADDAEEADPGAVSEKKSQKSSRSKKSKKEEEKVELQEIEWADQVLPVSTVAPNNAYQIYVIHQLPQRLLRQTIVQSFRSHLSKELDGINEEDMLMQVEHEAEEIEKNFFNQFYSDIPHYDFEIN